jgi:(R,R)-butanediol dehydrogenase/meso-butanediol dehydrogenase/diacetyl reductase
MRAAVYHGPGDLRIEQVPDPVPAELELLVRVAACGICGTDAAEYTTGPHLYWIGDAHPRSGHRGPLIPGHELVGRIEALGRDVTGFTIGELVASGAGVSCGTCRACRVGRTNICERYWTIGLQRHGGLAELVAVPAATCRSIEPYGLSEDAAALAQPMAIAAHAVDRGALQAGDEALVIGAGGIGGLIAYAATQAGASVSVCEREAGRRAIAERLGATLSFDPADRDMDSMTATADRVFEVSGSSAGLRLALAAVRPGGRVIAVGMQAPPSEIDLRSLSLREVDLVGSVAHRVAFDLPAALELLAARTLGWSDIAPVAIPLEAVVADGLAPLAAGASHRIKTLIDPRSAQTRPTVMSSAVVASA